MIADAYVSTVVLPGGQSLDIRAIRPEDKPLLRAEFHRLSPASIRSRFFVNKRELDAAELDRLTNVDFVRDVAIVAGLREPGGPRPAGVARFAQTQAPGHAEIAITVAEGLHGHGIGTALLNELAKLASARGIHTFVADVLAENKDMIDVLRHSGFARTSSTELGVMTITLDVSAPRSVSTQND